MRIDYDEMAKVLASLTEGEDDTVALMATMACELHHADDSSSAVELCLRTYFPIDSRFIPKWGPSAVCF